MSMIVTATAIAENAILAAKNCLEKAKLPIEEVGLLINAGVYREDNMVEPAISAFIQKELGLNLDYVKNNNGKAAFSFDLLNGACGVLNAVQVAQASKLSHVLIVTGNKNPRYACIGAAMLLGRSQDETQGFGHVYTRASMGGYVGLKGYTRLYQPDSRTRVTLEEDPNYESQLTDFTASCIKDLRSAEITLVAPARCGHKLEIACVDTAYENQDSRVAGPIVGYQAAIGRPKPLLFVAGGAGLSAAWTLYS